MNYIQTDGGLHVIVKGKPITLSKSDPHFLPVVEALKRKATEDEVLEIIEAEKRRMEEAIQVVPGIELKGGQLYHHGETIAGVLGSRMLQMLEEGFDLSPMAAFLDNLQANPSMRVVNHLYAFLEHGKNPITEDGCFLAYKAVRLDFKDIHSGTFDNSVGQALSMNRNRVDEDSQRTCSYGFHVCSFDYLPHFANVNGHVMVCKVNPADVVAIPADYNNTKMRVCKYEVVGEFEGYYKNEGDVLSSASVAGSSRGLTFKVEFRTEDGGHWQVKDSCDRLVQAAQLMEQLLDDARVHSVRVVNVDTDAIVAEQDNDNFVGEFDNDDDVPTYSVWHVLNGSSTLVDDGYDSVSDAASRALDEEDPGSYEIRDQFGAVMKTIS